MKKVKHTKNELKRQKDALKMFSRYLPTLILKKQQLQQEIVKIYSRMEDIEMKIKGLRKAVYKWTAVFAEEMHIEQLVTIEKIHTSIGNIAGIDIPVFKSINFKEKDYDFLKIPLWVDYGIEAVKELDGLKIQYQILQRQRDLIREELRITTQRVNLFEKVKIPETQENIRRIRIFLGDLQTAAVVTGKVAKNKIQKKSGALI